MRFGCFFHRCGFHLPDAVFPRHPFMFACGCRGLWAGGWTNATCTRGQRPDVHGACHGCNGAHQAGSVFGVWIHHSTRMAWLFSRSHFHCFAWWRRRKHQHTNQLTVRFGLGVALLVGFTSMLVTSLSLGAMCALIYDYHWFTMWRSRCRKTCDIGPIKIVRREKRRQGKGAHVCTKMYIHRDFYDQTLAPKREIDVLRARSPAGSHL